ncbi:MAG: hypothetical protein U0Q16_06165 [Bryobacteraceae bacterium]
MRRRLQSGWGEWDEARRLVAQGLATNPPREFAEQLRKVVDGKPD